MKETFVDKKKCETIIFGETNFFSKKKDLGKKKKLVLVKKEKL